MKNTSIFFSVPRQVKRARFVAGCGFGPQALAENSPDTERRGSNAHGQVLVNFDEGRVEEWLEGRAPTHKEKSHRTSFMMFTRLMRNRNWK